MGQWQWPQPILLKPIEEGPLQVRVWNPKVRLRRLLVLVEYMLIVLPRSCTLRIAPTGCPSSLPPTLLCVRLTT